MSVVTRFPPSPTGFMHIGNARTALFNYLYARRHGGKFLVRIEDTDRKRHSEEAVQAIIEGLDWMGLEHDGEITSQFARQDHHKEIAEELLAKGQAYYCYCSPEELEQMREAAKESGAKTFYDRRWRDKGPEDAPEGIAPVVRIKAPLDGVTTIKDHVQGEVSVPNDQLDDFIILRSDGTPTYMLSVVVDDYDMGVTHILRGDDHLNNTFRQKVIIDAMGWDLPEYAHLPMILGQDGSKFSKRHGAQGVHDFRDMGYLPEALCNYLLRLGWSHGDDEIISREQAIEWFDLEHIGKSGAKFDYAKLENLNAHYISEGDINHILEYAAPFYKSRHGIELDDLAIERITKGQDELKSRAKTLIQFADESVFYAKSSPLNFDEKAQSLIDDGQEVLKLLLEGFSSMSEINSDSVKDLCQSIADSHMDGKLGKVAMPLRAAITGTTVSPSIFEACAILGAQECCTRLNAALK
ncbi:MAG: glutamate--tRNA ligase [Alphaproteobacteria bacterium]|nr:glutamate--tRNA ligase [Alphaproteobacteria bacterium]